MTENDSVNNVNLKKMYPFILRNGSCLFRLDMQQIIFKAVGANKPIPRMRVKSMQGSVLCAVLQYQFANIKEHCLFSVNGRLAESERHVC